MRCTLDLSPVFTVGLMERCRCAWCVQKRMSKENGFIKRLNYSRLNYLSSGIRHFLFLFNSGNFINLVFSMAFFHFSTTYRWTRQSSICIPTLSLFPRYLYLILCAIMWSLTKSNFGPGSIHHGQDSINNNQLYEMIIFSDIVHQSIMIQRNSHLLI